MLHLLRFSRKSHQPSSDALTVPPPRSLRHVGRALFHWRILTPFYQQLAALLSQGRPLPEALRLATAETPNARLRMALKEISAEIESGSSLHGAMARRPHIFPDLTVNTIAAAETAGALAEALDQLATRQHQMEQVVGQIAPFVLYPALLAGLIVFELLFIISFVFPKYMQLYQELGITSENLPWVTRVIYPLLQALLPFLWALILVVLVGLATWSLWAQVARGNFRLQLLRIRLPIFGKLTQQLSLGRAASALTLLLGHRVRLDQALRLAGAASDDLLVDMAFRQAAVDVSEGRPLTDSLRSTNLLPDEFVADAAAAEASGTLPQRMRDLSESYWQQAIVRARTWPMVAAPLAVLGLGVMLAIVGLSIFSPLIAIIGELSG